MPRLAVVVHSAPGTPDQARGALDIFRSRAWQAVFAEVQLIHVHALSAREWPGPYDHTPDIALHTRPGEAGRAERINGAVAAATASGADYGLICDNAVWPLFPAWFGQQLTIMARSGKLLGGAAVEASARTAVPRGGIWAQLFALDLHWQRARRMFPLPWEQYAATVAVRLDQWEVSSADRCLSGAFFQRVAESVTPEEARAIAAGQLQRWYDLEPIVDNNQPVRRWHETAITRDPQPQQRAELVRLRQATYWGPTLQRLATDRDLSWFDSEHPHPNNQDQDTNRSSL
jgi:hypothetical protein